MTAGFVGLLGLAAMGPGGVIAGTYLFLIGAVSMAYNLNKSLTYDGEMVELLKKNPAVAVMFQAKDIFMPLHENKLWLQMPCLER